jgi:hypothetical protein
VERYKFFIVERSPQQAEPKQVERSLQQAEPKQAAVEEEEKANFDALPALNAAITESSISGLSSGAFMAVQFGTAWSSIIKGVGVISGGPFYCAQASLAIATGACMKGAPPPLSVSIDLADRKEQTGDIDPTDNLRRQQIYLFHGYNDGTVGRRVTDAAAGFYEHYLGEKGHLFYQTTVGAGHALVADTPDTVNLKLNDCSASTSPFIDRCGSYDQAGVILRYIYGALNAPPPDGFLSGTVEGFDQTRYAKPDTPGTLSLATPNPFRRKMPQRSKNIIALQHISAIKISERSKVGDEHF